MPTDSAAFVEPMIDKEQQGRNADMCLHHQADGVRHGLMGMGKALSAGATTASPLKSVFPVKQPCSELLTPQAGSPSATCGSLAKIRETTGLGQNSKEG